MDNTVQKHIDVLDGIRAVAIVLVVWYHVWQQTWLTPYIVFDNKITKYFGISNINLATFVRYGAEFADMLILLSALSNFYPYARSILFGVDIPREKLERFILDSRYYSRAKNRRLFQLSLEELKKIKKSKIENFKLNNKDLEEIIYFKENNFELKEFFLLRDLDTRTYKFLRSLGYKSMNCKLVYED